MTDERTPPSDGASGRPGRAAPAATDRGYGRDPGARPAARAERAARHRLTGPWRHRRRGRRPTATEPRERRRRTVAEVLAEVPEDAVIVARRLTKQYGDFTAVDSLDLTIRAGEVFGLLGPNGAGKTTTVLMLLGLTEPTRGIVRVLGLDPTREPLAVKRQVGYLPDNVGFYGGLTGRENLRYTAKLNGIPRSVAEARIDELLHEVRLEDAADPSPRPTRAACASGWASRTRWSRSPTVLILDEPTIAIDPAGVEELLALLRRLVKERNLTVLLSSPHPGPGPVPVRPGRVLLGGPAHRRGTARGAGPRHGPAHRARGRDRRRPGGDRSCRARVPGVTSVEPDPREERLRVVTANADVAARARLGPGRRRPVHRPPAATRLGPARALSPLRPGGPRWPLAREARADAVPRRPAARSGRRPAAGGRSPARSSPTTSRASASSSS